MIKKNNYNNNNKQLVITLAVKDNNNNIADRPFALPKQSLGKNYVLKIVDVFSNTMLSLKSNSKNKNNCISTKVIVIGLSRTWYLIIINIKVII